MKKQDGYRGSWTVKNEKGLPVTDKVKYIMYDLTLFDIPQEKICTDEQRWLYLLKTAGKSDGLPDFGDRVIAAAIKRILVKNASEQLLRDQAKNMVMTEEELDYLAFLKVRAEEQGRAIGEAKGRAIGEVIGEAKGRDKRNEEMALDMLADNKPIEEIVKYSHLSEEKVLELQRLAK